MAVKMKDTCKFLIPPGTPGGSIDNNAPADDLVYNVTKLAVASRAVPSRTGRLVASTDKAQEAEETSWTVTVSRSAAKTRTVAQAQKGRDLFLEPLKVLSLFINSIAVPQSTEGATWHQIPRWSEIGLKAWYREMRRQVLK